MVANRHLIEIRGLTERDAELIDGLHELSSIYELNLGVGRGDPELNLTNWFEVEKHLRRVWRFDHSHQYRWYTMKGCRCSWDGPVARTCPIHRGLQHIIDKYEAERVHNTSKTD